MNYDVLQYDKSYTVHVRSAMSTSIIPKTLTAISLNLLIEALKYTIDSSTVSVMGDGVDTCQGRECIRCKALYTLYCMRGIMDADGFSCADS